MTVKFVQVGNVVDYTAGADISAGDLVLMSHTIGVALTDIANGDTGAVAIEGVFEGVPKVSAAEFAVGEKLILDVSATPDAFDDSSATPATGDITGGAIAVKAGTNGQTTCTIKLTPGNATKT
jgi:predicted RecA/RadA family phage recombinase